MAPLLDIRDLVVRFHTPDGIVHAVNDVTYTLQEGETLGIVGESGSGKSVHALSILRLIPSPPGRIERGEVIFNGKDLLKLPDSEIRRVRGGEIAMALSCDPKLLIADEPTTALDVTIQAQIIELVKDLKRRLGMAIIWITHDLGVVAGIADTVQVMYAGRVVERGPVRAVFKDTRSAYTYGLLRSLPRADAEKGGRLQPIPGTPPDMVDPPPGDAFAPRNPYATERCWQETPPLAPVQDGDPNHLVAAWYDLRTAVRTQAPDQQGQGAV